MKKYLAIIVSLLVILSSSYLYAAIADNPEQHAYHSFVDDGLFGDIEQIVGGNKYSPSLPNIPGSVYIDEVYLKIKFGSGISPDINRIAKVNSCLDEQSFLDPANDFHSMVDGNFLILVNNYIDDRFTDLLSDADCWSFEVTGDHDVVGAEMNITYHNDSGTDTSGTDIMQDYYSADGYVSESGNFNGKSTLSVIPNEVLENEKACEPISNGLKVPLNTENLIVMVHGWNPEGYKNYYAPGPLDNCQRAIESTPNLEFSWYHLYANLSSKVEINDDWVVSRYDWSEDASNGLISLGLEFTNANEVRDRSHVHGLRLGKIIDQIRPKRIQLIAHSAGNWATRRAADYLRNRFGNNIEIELIALDPFVNDFDRFTIGVDLDLKSDFEITKNWVDKAKNYYVDDSLTDIVGYTSGNYFGWDKNLQLDFGSNGGSEYQSYHG